ncbi:hypothetical protein DM860_004514 [Cuscuta australis]|uniref:Uncharacterized protein n=1 Tax=Cuscuta australis TaxID=267555 RepID=A0A328EBT0_9ASTE|nr:hypothetical protein DM860_004514 [Cuscuta australis]
MRKQTFLSLGILSTLPGIITERRLKEKFGLVIGIVHTNYPENVKREHIGLEALIVKYINVWVVNIYCHRLSHETGCAIKVPVYRLQELISMAMVMIDVEPSSHCRSSIGDFFFPVFGAWVVDVRFRAFQHCASNCGSLLQNVHGPTTWKGSLLNLLAYNSRGNDIAGLCKIKNKRFVDQVKFHSQFNFPLCVVRMHGQKEMHPNMKLYHHHSEWRLILMASSSKVVRLMLSDASTTILNEFFKQFPNCRTYDSGTGFVTATLRALTEQPAPLTDDDQRHEPSLLGGNCEHN